MRTQKRRRVSFDKKRKTTPDIIIRLAACPVCFQMDDSTVVDGVRLAVVVLLAVTIVVLTGFVRFALRVARAQQVDR